MAGLFGFFNYEKPGKGVRKDEEQHSHFVQYFVIMGRKFWDMAKLNLLFLVFCLPVVTIGPALAGFTYVLRNYNNGDPVFMFSDFWDNFKGNFKQSFVTGLLSLVLGFLLFTGTSFYFQNGAQNSLMYLPAGVMLVVSVVFLFANFYIPLMIVTLDLPLKGIIKNSVILAILGIKANIFTLLGLLVFFILAWMFEILAMLFFIFVGVALMGLLIIHNSYPVLKKYAIDPYYAELNKEEAPDETEDDGEEENLFLDEFSASKELPEDEK